MAFKAMKAWGRGFRFVLIAAFFLPLAFGLGALLGHVVKSAPERALKALSARLQARYHNEVRLFFELNGITPHSRFVVAELKQTVSGSYASRKNLLGLDLGTTSLEYRVPVRFFYAVDFSDPNAVALGLRPGEQILTATFPSVELLSAEPDIGRLERRLTVGWGRMERFSGSKVEHEFMTNVMADIKAHADDEGVRTIVRETARRQLAEFVRTYLAKDRPAFDALEAIEVRFADESETEALPQFPLKPRAQTPSLQIEAH